jgi:xylan 1,4-beta-xylosidase
VWANVTAAGLPLVITEFSAGLDNNAYDAPFAASFIVHSSAAILGVPSFPTLSFWTFTDIFEEPGFQSQPYNAKFGIQTIYGVPKPAYRGLQLLRQLPTTALAVAAGPGLVAAPRSGGPAVRRDPTSGATATVGTVDVIAAMDDSLSTTLTAAALVTNFNYNANNAEDPSTGLPVSNETVSVTFSGIPANAVLPATASVTLLDANNGWAKPLWVAAGKPTYPNATEVAAELAASQFAVLAVPIAANGTGSVTVTLPTMIPYAVALVRLTYEVPPV